MSSHEDIPVVISGIGLISSLGVGIDPLWDAMVSSKTGLKRIQRFNPDGFASQVAGELSDDILHSFLDQKSDSV